MFKSFSLNPIQTFEKVGKLRFYHYVSSFNFYIAVTKTCGQTASVNCTYFQSAGYPSTYNSVGSCQLTINKISDNVCQLR